MRRGIKNLLPVGIEIAASGTPLAGRNHVSVGAVHVHGEDLIALQIVAGGLQNQLLAVSREIGFSIRSPEGELAHISQVLLLRRGQIRGRRALLSSRWRQRKSASKH